jgi:hypothetical protein
MGQAAYPQGNQLNTVCKLNPLISDPTWRRTRFFLAIHQQLQFDTPETSVPEHLDEGAVERHLVNEGVSETVHTWKSFKKMVASGLVVALDKGTSAQDGI